MTKPRRPKTDGEDDAVFEAVMRDVRPLKRPAPAQKPKTPQKSASDDVKTPTKKPKPAPAGSAPAAPAVIGGGLDRRTAERLRRGRLAIDGRIDLHGHTQADAHRALHAFVRNAYDQGRRTLLVITGKGAPRSTEASGFMPDREIGVLRRNVPRWLSEPAVRGMVLAVEPARPQHGGSGAYYVLLRRQS